MQFSCDFETTTNPDDCRVWAFGLTDIDNPDNFMYGNSVKGLMNYCELTEKTTLYFHNLKFDGEFILVWLFENGFKYVEDRKKLTSRTFTALISDTGLFYSLEICWFKRGDVNNTTKIYDSLKVLPMKVEEIAKSFDLPIRKLVIDYDKHRPVGYELTEEEIDYLRNDCEIVGRALNLLHSQGLKQITQGSNALHDYKKIVGKDNFNRWFPIPDYDYDIRKSYKGGFTYLNPKYKGKDVGKGIVLDVNSLYPSVMYYKPLPYGRGKKFEGKYQKDDLYNLYTQTLVCNFELKEGYLPTIQLKNHSSFCPTEYLESSEGEDITLTLTNIDLELFFEHYNVYNVEYLGGWKFKSTTGLFKDYIDKWVEVKNKATVEGNKGLRQLAKLMLNALYGKFALNPKVRSKIPVYTDGKIKYALGKQETRDPIYIPVGTFITSWARYITISSAQKVYPHFIYADTDSLHLDIDLPDELFYMNEKDFNNLTSFDLEKYHIKELENLKIHPTELGLWKLEKKFIRARFLRQKSYVEESIASNTFVMGDLYGSTNFDITCAGMPSNCYQYVTWDNFKTGNNFEGKLKPSHVKGGIVLEKTPFSIR